ncbi:hypothetical protein I603_2134 [Erythrobacter dokdonensis DSW-74]|uniref:Uncharacterized protein n=1 Tax=Erythrobacter dokdonensis DSW-74 TaxID=1300349 RepID=A0A1A7BGI7_9SPHN|nr:hypothetical protein I603_2134 [Erythrobacter dokdonensis DSW-74]
MQNISRKPLIQKGAARFLFTGSAPCAERTGLCTQRKHCCASRPARSGLVPVAAAILALRVNRRRS